jgi:hypothetical protein
MGKIDPTGSDVDDKPQSDLAPQTKPQKNGNFYRQDAKFTKKGKKQSRLTRFFCFNFHCRSWRPWRDAGLPPEGAHRGGETAFFNLLMSPVK